jgi:hypothetical protein
MALTEIDVTKRFLVALLVVLVGVPWSALPASAGRGCSMPKAPSCGSCEPVTAAGSNAEATLRAGCCRYLPHAERVLAQAGSLGTTAKPTHSPDVAAVATPQFLVTPGLDAPRSRDAGGSPPPHAPPTRTTHLQL